MNAKTTHTYRRMSEANLIDRIGMLMSRVKQCRQRRWNRKLEQTKADLRTALAELHRRTGWPTATIAEVLTERLMEQ